MQFYRPESTAPSRGDLIDIADPDQRLWKALVMGEDVDSLERALQHGARITAEAQERFRPRMLAKADYLSAAVPIPLVSERLMGLLSAHDPALRGYPCTVVCRGKEFSFVACRIDDRRDLMDEDATTWRTSSSGSKFPLAMAFRGDQADDFLLTRDRAYPSTVLASQRLVDLCAAERMNIGFAPVRMATSAGA